MKSHIQLLREEMLRPVKEIEAKMKEETEKKIAEALKKTEAKKKIMEGMMKFLGNKGY